MPRKPKRPVDREYPINITIDNPKGEEDVGSAKTEGQRSPATPSPVEDQRAEEQDRDQILDIDKNQSLAETPVKDPTEESPSYEPGPEIPEQQAREPKSPIDKAPTESAGDVRRDNWQATVAEVAQQPRFRRGYTERALKFSAPQIAVAEDQAVFRHSSTNRVLQRAVSDGLDHRYALIASSILSDPILKDTISPADIDAVMFTFLDGQISRLRARAQECVNPVERVSEWQRVGQLEQIRDHFTRHGAWAE